MVTSCDSLAEKYLTLDDKDLLGQCDVDHYRSRGPGGQKRNKTSSAVRLRHRPTGLASTAADDRSQRVNRIRGIRRLREAIALQVRTEVDLPRYERSALLAECVAAGGRFLVNPRDRRYYRATGEILDVLASCRARVREAAGHMGLSTANLIKLLRSDRKLWKRANEMRAEAGLKPLR